MDMEERLHVSIPSCFKKKQNKTVTISELHFEVSEVEHFKALIGARRDVTTRNKAHEMRIEDTMEDWRGFHTLVTPTVTDGRIRTYT
jgi:hypothetical protein